MIYYNEDIITKKVISRLIHKLECDGMVSSSHTEIAVLGLKELFDRSVKKIAPHFPRFGVGYAEINIVHTLAMIAVIKILKRSLSTNFIDLNFQVEYIAIDHRIQLIW